MKFHSSGTAIGMFEVMKVWKPTMINRPITAAGGPQPAKFPPKSVPNISIAGKMYSVTVPKWAAFLANLLARRSSG